MKKKIFILFILLELFIFAFTTISFAEENVSEDEIMETQKSLLDISGFLEEAEKYTKNTFEDLELGDLFNSAITGNIDNTTIIKSILNLLGKEILDSEENVSTIGFTSDTKDIFNDVMENMNFVVWILIVAAGLLAIVVLYNLSNTNISERIRELATIKVLGFYNKEVYDYVSRETIILTIIGILLGLLGGYVLTSYIIKNRGCGGERK